MGSATPRITMIHATTVAVAPIEEAFRRDWPESRRFNLTDDALSPDLEAIGRIDDRLTERIATLATMAWRSGADAVLFTCSAFGPAVEAVARVLPIPVLKPNEAMFDDALAAGRRIGMVATFAPAVSPMEAEFDAAARAQGSNAGIETICVPDALAAARSGDLATHDRLVAEAATGLAHCDAVMLAQFSTSTAAPEVARVVTCSVLTSPRSAVLRLRRLLG